MIRDAERLIEDATTAGDTELAHLIEDRLRPGVPRRARSRSSPQSERLIRRLCSRYELPY